MSIEFEYECREGNLNPEHRLIYLYSRVNGADKTLGYLWMSQEEFDRFCILMAKGKVFEEFEEAFRDTIKEKLVGTG